jgi:hypothetical protein
MSNAPIGPLSQEEMQQMIQRDVDQSKSIYAPSGPPDPRLRVMYKGVSSSERTIQLVTSDQVKIDVTFLLDLEPLSGASPEVIDGMKSILLNDGQRHLASRKISVEASGCQDDPDRLVYACASSHRSRIKKFIQAWNKS